MSGKRIPIEDRFWSKVDKTGDCWIWTGAKASGYGIIGRGGAGNGYVQAHRWSYQAIIGPIPDKYELDHLCRVPACVRPEHLEPVPKRVNQLRSPPAACAVNARKTHCVNDHEFTVSNTRITIRNGYERRSCRECDRLRARAKRNTSLDT